MLGKYKNDIKRAAQKNTTALVEYGFPSVVKTTQDRFRIIISSCYDSIVNPLLSLLNSRRDPPTNINLAASHVDAGNSEEALRSCCQLAYLSVFRYRTVTPHCLP